HPAASASFRIACAAGGGGALTMQSIYLKRRDDLLAAEQAVAAKSTPATRASVDQAKDRFDSARRWRGIVTTGAGALWGLNVLDAMIRFPRFRAGRAWFEIAPGPPLGSRLPPAAGAALARFGARF